MVLFVLFVLKHFVYDNTKFHFVKHVLVFFNLYQHFFGKHAQEEGVEFFIVAIEYGFKICPVYAECREKALLEYREFHTFIEHFLRYLAVQRV